MSVRSSLSAAVTAAIGVATLSLFAVSVQAAAEKPAPTATVALKGYDLSKHSDAQALYTRLRLAARSVCRSIDGNDLRSRREHAACYNQALDNAVDSVGSEQLTALHRAADDGVRIAASEARPRT